MDDALKIMRYGLFLIAGAISSYLFQIAYMFINNSWKGSGVNVDGESYGEIGAFIVSLLIICFIVVLTITCMNWHMGLLKYSKKSIGIAILCFFIGVTVFAIIWEVLYSAPHVLNIFNLLLCLKM